MANLRYGIDLITFFHPGFWGLASEQAVVEYGRDHPRPFWDRILDSLAASDVTGIELTFAPFDWQNTLAAYGSAAAFRAELERRGLCIAAGFFADAAIAGNLGDNETCAEYIRRAGAYAEYLQAMDADIMVMGLPMRTSWDAQPPRFNDLAQLSQVADFCNCLGAEVLRRGVRLALHPETHSIFSMARDIDLLLLLTDPIYVGFCPDTAHLLLAGADPIDVIARHRPRMITAHWKDAIGPASLLVPIDEQIHLQHRPFFCALGTGRIDWSRWARLLRDTDFHGWAILEIDAVADPAAEVARSMAFIRAGFQPSHADPAGAR